MNQYVDILANISCSLDSNIIVVLYEYCPTKVSHLPLADVLEKLRMIIYYYIVSSFFFLKDYIVSS